MRLFFIATNAKRRCRYENDCFSYYQRWICTIISVPDVEAPLVPRPAKKVEPILSCTVRDRGGIENTMVLTFYHYSRCSTCVRARKYLILKGYLLKEIDLATDSPSVSALKKLIRKSARPYTDFLNRSGTLYRQNNMKEKVLQLSENQILGEMAEEGRLIKRPIVTDGEKVTVGFHESEFEKTWPKYP